MRTIRFALILPPLQMAIAWKLLTWTGQYSAFCGNTRAFCFAINAPIMLMLAPLYYLAPLHWLPENILGIRSDNFLVLIAVGILWLLVGHGIDRGRQLRLRSDPPLSSNLLFNAFFLVCGVWLFVRVGMAWILRVDSARHHMAFDILDGMFAIAWSVFMIGVPARRILGMIRRVSRV